MKIICGTNTTQTKDLLHHSHFQVPKTTSVSFCTSLFLAPNPDNAAEKVPSNKFLLVEIYQQLMNNHKLSLEAENPVGQVADQFGNQMLRLIINQSGDPNRNQSRHQSRKAQCPV
jgi:hypothetical protein